jgi:tetratricopeptide (TPR) repeat protein
MLDYHFGNINPFSYHVSNLILHTISVILFYTLLNLLNVTKKLAFLLALVFCVHPIVLHAVVWVPGRNDVLLTVFLLGSTIALINHLLYKNKKYLFLHLLLFLCALLTKENAIILPLFFSFLVFNLYKYTKPSFYIILSWLVLIIVWFTLKKNVNNTYPSIGSDYMMTLKNFIFGYLLFIGKSLIPIQQSVFPTLKNASLIPGLLSITILIVAYFKLGVKNNKLAILGILIFFGMLAIPVWYGATSSNGEHYEHRIYTSLIGLLLFISQLNFNINSKLFNYTIALVIVLFSIKTITRMSAYKNEQTFIDCGIKETPEYYLFHFKKGDKLYEQRDFTSALTCYNTALQLQPSRVQIYNNRANAYCALRKKKEAIDDYNTAIKLSPNNPNTYLNRFIAYKNFGYIEYAMNDLMFLKQNHPNFIPLGMESEFNQIWESYKFDQLNKLILSEPKNGVLFINRAKLFMTKRMGKEALADLKHACELEPNNKDYKSYFNELNSSFPN